MPRIGMPQGSEIPNKVEDTADVDFKGVPPRIRIFLVKTFDDKIR